MNYYGNRLHYHKYLGSLNRTYSLKYMRYHNTFIYKEFWITLFPSPRSIRCMQKLPKLLDLFIAETFDIKKHFRSRKLMISLDLNIPKLIPIDEEYNKKP